MIYLAAAMIVAGVALFVAAPLAGGLIPLRRKGTGEVELEMLEHDRGLAVQALRELEFDREMGKLSDADYDSLHAALENRALTAMASIEKLRADTASKAAAQKPALRVEPIRRPELPRPIPPAPAPIPPPRPIVSGAPRGVRYCPQCGTRTAVDARFCAECGLALRASGRATGWSE